MVKKKFNKFIRGFTLIELLTVVAIIGILSSILYVAIDPKDQTDSAKNKKVLYELSEARSQSALFWSDNNFSFEGVCDDMVNLAFGGDCQDNINSWAKTGIFVDNSKCCADSDGYIGTEKTEIAEYAGEYLCAGSSDGEDEEGGDGGGGGDEEGGDDDDSLDCSDSEFPAMCCGAIFSVDLCNMTPGCSWGWFMCGAD